MIDLPQYQTSGVWVPNSQNRWHNGYPKGKKWKISYIFYVPAAHAEYSATDVIPPVGVTAAVKILPCHMSQFAPTVHRGSPKRAKVENVLYIPRSSGPRQVQRHQCYTTCRGHSCCKKTTVPYLPIRSLRFTGGQKSAAPLG